MLGKMLDTDGSGDWSWLSPFLEINLKIVDFGECDVMGDEIRHEWVVPIIMPQSFINFSLKSLVPVNQALKGFFSELNLLDNIESEIILEILEDRGHYRRVVRYILHEYKKNSYAIVCISDYA